ncbi:hypothetical protein KIPB_011142, partial [Kipferlia bialata]
YDTWEWCLSTGVWTQVEDCPIIQLAGQRHGTTHNGTHHMCIGDIYLSYRDRRWTVQIMPLADEAARCLLSVPLYGAHQLIELSKRADYPRGFTKSFYVWDPVSQDLTPLAPLPLTERQMRYVHRCETVMLNPCTMLSIASDIVLLVDIDPCMLGPEYYSS